MKLPEVRRGDWVIIETETGATILPLQCLGITTDNAKALAAWVSSHADRTILIAGYPSLRRMMENILDEPGMMMVGFELHENSYGIRATATDDANDDEGWSAVCGTEAEAIEQLAEDGLGLPYVEAERRAWEVAMNAVRREFGIAEEGQS